jgi:3-oxoacyl-[acyl-carrier protein] reductase
MRLENDVAIITGAGSGMGRAGALRFAREGAKVVVADINEAAARETADLVLADGGEALAVTADASREDDNERTVAEALAAFGRLSVVWANAGIPYGNHPVGDIPVDAFDRLMAVNARGPWLAARAAVGALRESGGGAIVITASMSGLKGRANNSAYAMSKGAAVMMTQALALELAPDIRVNSVCPVISDTPMFPKFLEGAPDPEAARKAVLAAVPLKRMCTPEDIANAALFLASSEASMISGVNLRVDGAISA